MSGFRLERRVHEQSRCFVEPLPGSFGPAVEVKMMSRVPAILISLLVVSLSAPALEMKWSAPTLASTSDGARRVAAGDMDADGDMDLVMVSDVDDEVAWLENTGSGWTKYVISGTADGAIGLALGDIDGNGSLDVVAGMRDGNIVRWWSNDSGDGSSWTMEVIAPAANGVTDVEVGDIDADGDLDVAGAVTGAGEVRWWQQTSRGWTARVLAGNPTGVNDVALGDADGDGYLDVFGLVPGFTRVSWWENPRPGAGVPWTRTDVSVEDDLSALAVVDLDRDGDADVIAGDRFQDTLVWWANDGTGAAGSWTRTNMGSVVDPTSATPVDLDLDGDLDVLVTGDGGTVSWVESVGDAAGWTWRQIAAAAPAFGAVAVDLDLDGDPDVAWADPVSGMVETSANLLNHRGALFNDGYIGLGGVGFQFYEAPSLGDLDGDGDEDLVVFDRDDVNGALWRKVLVNRNPGAPHPDGYPYMETSVVQSGDPLWFGFENATDIEIGDLDGDGDGDLLIAQQGSVVNFLTWCENTDGLGTTWSCSKTYDVDDGGAPDLRRNLALGDIDGDGDLDFAAYYEWWDFSGAYGLRWWENLGDMSQISNWKAHDVAQVQVRDQLRIVDIDGDGDQDIIGSEGPLRVYLNNGDGTAWTNTAMGFSEEDFVVGDIDLDGDLDIASHTASSARYRWWEQQDPTIWVLHEIDAVDFGGGFSADVQGIDLADMDLDGDLDVLGTTELNDMGTFAEGHYVWYENRLLDDPARLTGTVEEGWAKHEMPFGGPNAPIYALDLDGDADPEFCIQEYLMWQWIYANAGATVHTAFELLAPVEVTEGQVVTVGALFFDHAGRSGDREVILTELNVLFSDRLGNDPFTQAQVDALVGSLTLRGDDGDGVAESTDPVLLTLTSAPSVTDGVATFALPSSAEVMLPCCGEERMLSLWLEIGADAASAGLPDPVQISFEGQPAAAMDTIDGLEVSVSPFFDDAEAEFTVFESASDELFSDGFEDGTVNAWTFSSP